MRNTRIFFLSDGHAAHSVKWVNALINEGYTIFLFSLSPFDHDQYIKSDRLQLFTSNLDERVFDEEAPVWKKLLFLTQLNLIKKKIAEFKPDILHANYASSYGLLGALSSFKPNIVSVWGTDIYSFPRNFINKSIIKYTFAHTDKILSTSKAMRTEILKYTSKEVELTPFGIDTSVFSPDIRYKDNSCLTIGTIKNVTKSAGTDILIRAYHLFRNNHPELKTRLLLVGGGPALVELKDLANQLGISEETEFTGDTEYTEMVRYHNIIDIFVCVSRIESFGVAVLEASSCGNPVIVSDIGGLPEVVEKNHTGYFVKSESVEETAAAIERLALNKDLREQLGKNGREFVCNKYELDKCVETMISVYDKLL